MKDNGRITNKSDFKTSNGMNSIASSILISGLIIAGAIILVNSNNSSRPVVTLENADNVSIVDGKQIIEITAKGGYYPGVSTAKANIQTILRFNTNGTFDCSSFVRIPKLNITEYLPQSGITDVDLGTQPVGLLQGTCGMGMYPFEVDFLL